MASEDGLIHGIRKFDGINFAFKRMQIEDYLYDKKLHLLLLETKLEEKLNDDWGLLDRQVLGIIRLTLSKNVTHNVAKEKLIMGLMKVLSNIYEKSSTSNKVFLMQKLFYLKIGEGALVATHLNEFSMTISQFSYIEIDFCDEVRALILLVSLTNSWEPMRVIVSNSMGSAKLKFNDMRNRILEEVRKIDSSEASTSSFALNLENRGKGNDKNSNQNKSR